MTFLSDADLSLIDSLGQFLAVLGVVGAVSLFFFPRDRHIQERSLGVLFTLIAAGGVALSWRVDRLLSADRDLTPAQQATLTQAISRFPTARFEVFTSRGNREARSLAQKIVNAVKAGSGAPLTFSDEIHSLPWGVVLVFADKDADLRREVSDTVGRRLMAARIAVVTDSKSDLGENTVRIVVGDKP